MKKGYGQGFTETVAVKTLKGFMQKELVNEMMRECDKMKDFDHPNVLGLKGVCLDGGPAPFIIMSFMSKGSLLGYLKENRETLVMDPTTTNADDVVSRSVSIIMSPPLFYIYTHTFLSHKKCGKLT